MPSATDNTSPRFICNPAAASIAPAGTLVVDGCGEAWQKAQDGRWYGIGDTEPANESALFILPRKVLWTHGQDGIGYQDYEGDLEEG